MTTSESQPTSRSQLISPATRLGHVYLTVADLEGQLAFYQDVLGLRLHWREGATAGLGAGQEDLLRLTEVRGARRVRRSTGLYHFALEYPSRHDLALARLINLRYRNYPTDLVMSKATYLDDPEGQNIELYALSPEDGTSTERNGHVEIRRADGRRVSGPEALDVEALLREVQPVAPVFESDDILLIDVAGKLFLCTGHFLPGANPHKGSDPVERECAAESTSCLMSKVWKQTQEKSASRGSLLTSPCYTFVRPRRAEGQRCPFQKR